MNEAAARTYLLETKLLEDLLGRVERGERAILTRIGCPTKPTDIYAILAGERPAPWKARTAARDRQRALHAMHVLVQISRVRQNIRLGHQNARLAAHAALLAGLYAHDGALNAALAAKREKGGRTRGQQKAAGAQQHHASIVREYRRWQVSDELRDLFPSPSTYIRGKVSTASLRTIQRAVKKLARQ